MAGSAVPECGGGGGGGGGQPPPRKRTPQPSPWAGIQLTIKDHGLRHLPPNISRAEARKTISNYLVNKAKPPTPVRTMDKHNVAIRGTVFEVHAFRVTTTRVDVGTILPSKLR